jgi:hypothetical protein
VVHEIRRRHQHIVARIRDAQERRDERLVRAGGDDDLRVGIDSKSIVLRDVGGDQRAQLRDAV